MHCDRNEVFAINFPGIKNQRFALQLQISIAHPDTPETDCNTWHIYRDTCQNDEGRHCSGQRSKISKSCMQVMHQTPVIDMRKNTFYELDSLFCIKGQKEEHATFTQLT